MIFRLKTSKRTQEIFEELESRTNYKPYTLVKHAIAWSLRENTSAVNYYWICIIMLERLKDMFYKH